MAAAAGDEVAVAVAKKALDLWCRENMPPPAERPLTVLQAKALAAELNLFLQSWAKKVTPLTHFWRIEKAARSWAQSAGGFPLADLVLDRDGGAIPWPAQEVVGTLDLSWDDALCVPLPALMGLRVLVMRSMPARQRPTPSPPCTYSRAAPPPLRQGMDADAGLVSTQRGGGQLTLCYWPLWPGDACPPAQGGPIGWRQDRSAGA
jgi:hypothetical protein